MKPEFIEAIGSILGGIMGAGGSAIAVYLMLSGQRNEDRQRIQSALIREVIEFARIIVGHLETCENILTRAITLPASKLSEALQIPAPIIYPAIADRIGLLKSPQRIVAFYIRLFEIGNMAQTIANGPIQNKMLAEDDIQLIVEAFLDICQFAHDIIQDVKPGKDFDKIITQKIIFDMAIAAKLAKEALDNRKELMTKAI